MTTSVLDRRTLAWSTSVLILLALGALVGASAFAPVPDSASHAPAKAAPVRLSTLAAPLPAAPAPSHPSLRTAAGGTGPGQNATSSGVPGWDNVTNTSGKSPAPRSYGRSFAYDPVDQYLVMFGGYGTGGGYLADTWAYANGSWTQIHPKASPIARDHSTLAWDPIDGYVLMFGGSGTGGAYSDTWTFLHGNWTQLTPSSHPSARWASAMTWDAADSEMVLFGGCAGSAVGDTWTFVGGNWTQVNPASAPSARENVALRYDAADSEVILFGGDDYYSATDSDTWAFHAGNWTQLNESVHPSARSMASFTYDVAISSLVLFGGNGIQTFGDTWLFSGGQWTVAHPIDSPAPRFFGEMAYDPSTAEAVLWGGAGGLGDLTDTWAYAGVNLTANDSASFATGSIRVGFDATAVGGSGAISYLWQFGDGNVSTEPATSNFYGTPGRYLATVSASDGNGSSASASFFVRVIAPLTASAQAFPTTGVVPLTVQCSFAASGGSAPYHVLWTAGAGSNSSTSDTATFVYGASGTFTATVNVTDSAGATWNESFPIVAEPLVVAPLVSGVVASVSYGAAPLQVWFSSSMSGGVLPYTTSWAFGDGSTATGTVVNHTFSTPGDLTTTFTVTDGRGIMHASAVNLTIGPDLSATGTAPPTAVANSSVSFSGSVNGGEAPYTAVWEFGDSHAAAAIDTTHAYASAGSYVATFTVVDHRGISVSQQFHVSVSAAAPNTNQSTHPGTNSGSSGSLGADTEVLALAVVGGAAMIAVAIVVVRRMDR